MQRRARSQNRRCVDQFELGMRREKPLDLRLVFFRQDAAGGINEATARCDTTRRTGENPCLQRGQFDQTLLILAPFQIRVAAQGPDAATRRIHQHALRLACQSAHPRVVLMLDRHRIDVGQATARKTRLGPRQARCRNVKSIKTPGRAHQRPEQQGLAAGASAKIDHHFAATGCHQQSQQLAALVLYLDESVFELVPFVHRWAPAQTNPPGGIRRRHR